MVTKIILHAIAAFLVLICLVQAFASSVYACSPVPPPDFESARNSASAIFVGRVVAIDDSPFAAISAALSDSEVKRVLFNVSSVWKGSVKSQVIVSINNKICSSSIYDFHKDKDFLIFANSGPLDSLAARAASRTRQLDRAAEDLTVLGDGKPPSEQAELGTLFYFQSYWSEAALGIILVVAFFWLRKVRRRKRL